MSDCRCEPKLEGLAELSEHPGVITAAYLVVIFPWGIMQTVDIISEKWRTVRHTRHLGYIHLALSIIPLPYIIFYAHLQQISSDYKEMMAAVVVILMAAYHTIRTIWCLVQLDAYHMWCLDLMERMLALKMIRAFEWRRKSGSAEVGIWEKLKRWFGDLPRKNNRDCGNHSELSKFSNALVDESDGVLENLDLMLKVNNKVVDNELGGTDIDVSVDWKEIGLKRPSAWLKTGEAQLCTARWGAAFLSEFGHYWASPTNDYSGRKYLEELFSSCSRSLESLKYVTFSVSDSRTRILNCIGCDSQKCGVYAVAIGELKGFYEDVEGREFVMDNIASSYPATDEKDRYVFIDLVLAILDVKRMVYSSLEPLEDYSSTFHIWSGSSGWNLLMWQRAEIPADRNSRLWHSGYLPAVPWGHLSVPLWDVCSNWRVLQATVHVDNQSWIDNPEEPAPYNQPPNYYFEYASKRAAKMNKQNRMKFSGCVLEMVRTFLADWIHTSSIDPSVINWTPLLPNDSLEFSNKANHHSFVWECQSVLQETIANLEKYDDNMAASPHLIMLFILAFPEIRDQSRSSKSHCNSQLALSTTNTPITKANGSEYSEDQSEARLYIFGSLIAPQDIKVSVENIPVNGEMKLVMKLVAGNSAERFKWEEWIDAAMEYVRGADSVITDENELNWRERTPSKCDLSRPLLLIPKDHPELPELHGDIRVWTGWPLFDIKVVQFEMNQWLQAAGLIDGSGDIVLPQFEFFYSRLHQEVEHAEAGLLKIMEWNRV